MRHLVLDTVFHAFNEAGVRWCLLRVPFDFGAPTGGDVDLLIDRADTESVRQILKTLGFVQLPIGGHSIHTHFISYHLATDC